MPYFTQEIPEGLKFDNQEEALAYFKTTLLEETPLGNLYEELHEVEDWNGFTLQATGLNNKELSLVLDKADLDSQDFQVVSFNTYGNDKELKSEDLIKTLQLLTKTNNTTLLIVNETLNEVYEEIDKGSEHYLKDVFTGREQIITRIEIASDLQNGITLAVALTDEVSNEQVVAYIPLHEDLHVEEEDIKKTVQNFFLKSIEGNFEGNTFSADGYSLSYILRYAELNNKKIKLEYVE